MFGKEKAPKSLKDAPWYKALDSASAHLAEPDLVMQDLEIAYQNRPKDDKDQLPGLFYKNPMSPYPHGIMALTEGIVKIGHDIDLAEQILDFVGEKFGKTGLAIEDVWFEMFKEAIKQGRIVDAERFYHRGRDSHHPPAPERIKFVEFWASCKAYIEDNCKSLLFDREGNPYAASAGFYLLSRIAADPEISMLAARLTRNLQEENVDWASVLRGIGELDKLIYPKF